jgi:hypothetical protein
MPPLIVFDFGLGVGIHHTMYCEEIGLYCMKIGHRLAYFAPRDDTIPDGYRGKSPTPEGFPDGVIRRELSLNLYNVEVENAKNLNSWRGQILAAERDFSRVLAKMQGGVVFLHTPRFYIILGLLRALQAEPSLAENFDRLVIELTTIGNSEEVDVLEMMSGLEIKGLLALREMLVDKFVTFAHTPERAENYRKNGLYCDVIPILVSKTENTAMFPKAVSFVGQPRSDKGVHVFLQAFVDLAKAGKIPAQFRVQSGSSIIRMPDLGSSSKLLSVIEGNPTRSTYRQSMVSSYPLVLPYVPKAYEQGRSSGMLYEAFYNRIPIICSEASIFTGWMQKYALDDFVFSPYDSTALANKILYFSRQNNIEERFSPLFDEFSEENGVECFFEVVLGRN